MKLLGAMAAAIAALGMASAAEASYDTDERKDDSIWVGTFGSPSSWRPVSRNALVLWAGPSRAYLVTIRRPLHSLRFADALGVSKTGGRITTFDNVYIGGERLPIKSIERIDAKAARALKYGAEVSGPAAAGR